VFWFWRPGRLRRDGDSAARDRDSAAWPRSGVRSRSAARRS